MNEDVKNSIVIPYLEKLELDPSGMHFEKTFKIRLGRNIHQIESRDKAKGRLDILVTQNQTNF